MVLIDLLYALAADTTASERGKHSVRVLDSIGFFDNEGWRHHVSIQASYAHYCTPRLTLPFELYTRVEVLASLPHEDIPAHWFTEYDDGSGSLFSFVPVAEANELLGTLIEKYTLDPYLQRALEDSGDK